MDVSRDRLLKVEYSPLDGLIPYVKNARTHSAEHVAEIAASIRAFGWTNAAPILSGGLPARLVDAPAEPRTLRDDAANSFVD